MPVMNGYDATMNIRSREVREGWKRSTIVALTANVRDVVDVSKFDEMLSKPLTRDRLKRMLLWIYNYNNGVAGRRVV